LGGFLSKLYKQGSRTVSFRPILIAAIALASSIPVVALNDGIRTSAASSISFDRATASYVSHDEYAFCEICSSDDFDLEEILGDGPTR
jgi:hypothetical protein